MAAEVGALFASLTADSRGLITGLRQSSQEITRFSRRANRQLTTTQQRINQLTTAMVTLRRTLVAGLATFGVGIGGFAMARQVRSVVSEVSELGKEARTIGITAEELQGLRHGFDLAGVSAQQLAQGLTTFTQRLGEAEQRGGNFARILEQQGVAIRDQDGNMRRSLDVLRDYADRIANARSESEQLALASAAFGDRAGRAMVRGLREGGNALDEMITAAREAGVVLDEDLVSAAERVDDRFAKLSAQIGTSFRAAVLTAIDAVDTMLDRLRTLENRSIVAPLEAELASLNAERERLNQIIENERNLLSQPGWEGDEAALANVESARSRIAEIEERSAEILNRIGELTQESANRTRDLRTEWDGVGDAVQDVEHKIGQLETFITPINGEIGVRVW